MGALLQITIYSLMELLQARNQAKQMARSANQTTVQLSENNPLKLSPTPEEAIRLLFGPPTRSYLDARRRLYPRLWRSEVASIQDIRRDAAGCCQAGCQRRSEGHGARNRRRRIVVARFEQEQIMGCVSDALDGASWRRQQHAGRSFHAAFRRRLMTAPKRPAENDDVAHSGAMASK